ncbi:hypothetical protein BurJ1DRAFT_2718 [Burkholderiales bacterium JOSHI_001]|nr:hypothetical protein BurJ1DRAFT_2718 [Burkholderiales bacterium JOSHI_001]
MSFGRPPASALLGSPLNFAVPVRLDMGDALAPECVGAEVQIGERKLLPGDVRVRLEPAGDAIDRVVRVTSPVAVDEPVLAVTVHVGCSNRMSRRFTLMVDPPMHNVPPVVAPPVVAESQPVAPSAAIGGTELPREPMAREPRAPSPAASAGPARVRRERVQRERPVAEVVRPPRAPRADRQALAAAPRPVKAPSPRISDALEEQASPRKLPRSSVADATRPAVVGGGGARLRLEADPAVAGMRPAEAAGSAPPLSPALSELLFQSEAAASAAARVQSLERKVDELLAESKANRNTMAAMRSRVSESELSAKLLPWLGGALAVMSGLALWLGLSLRRARSEQQAWWAQAGAVAATPSKAGDLAAAPVQPAPTAVAVVDKVPVGESVSDMMPLSAPPTMPMPDAGPMARVDDDAPVFDTEVIRGPGSGLPQREVAIDELIDLEQQADFFVALGQEDAAIDLLVSHIRGSGGTSPMAYLKLLEIYRKKGDAESYERTRTRFNHRFNAFAPDWDTPLQTGRELEQYPDVVRRLEAVWPDPLDAMAELEALMFRRDGGELFELPAYRELLFLFSLARDILDKEGGRPSGVDLLLPLGDAAAQGAHGPAGAVSDLSFDLPAPTGGARVAGPEPLEPAGFTLDSAPGGLDLNLASGPLPLQDATKVGPKAPVRVVDSDLDLHFTDLPPLPPRQ